MDCQQRPLGIGILGVAHRRCHQPVERAAELAAVVATPVAGAPRGAEEAMLHEDAHRE